MSYTESESMAIKRLKVALKRQDWEMYEYGIIRTLELINSGIIISEIHEWHKVLEESKAEKAPTDLIGKLKTLIEAILAEKQEYAKSYEYKSQPEIVQPIDVNQEAKPKIITPNIPLTIFIDKIINIYETKAIKKMRDYLNRLSFEPDTKIDSSLLNEIAELIYKSEKDSAELKGLGELLKSYPGPGVIVTSSYSNEIITILKQNHIDFYIEGIHKPSSDTYWTVYPLAGLTSIFYCPACKTKSFYPEQIKSVLTTCNNCHSAAYADLYPVDTVEVLVNPRTWYLAYQALTSSTNWMLVSPPGVTEKPSIYNLLHEASLNTATSNTFIITESTELGNWWKNKIQENISGCNVTQPCFNIEIALKNYINTSNG